MYGLSTAQLQLLYNGARKWFTLGSFVVGPVTLFIDAPFGRFTPSEGSIFHGIFLVDGIKSWIIMELVSPTFFLYTFFNAPLSGGVRPSVTLRQSHSACSSLHTSSTTSTARFSPRFALPRAPKHTSSRPHSHVMFNTFNGSLLGAFFSSPNTPQPSAFARTSFWIGLVMWAWGFVGNVVHDEILLNIRRKAKSKEHYAIPHGLLYRWVSFPNYFCEWVEWLGFAIAADPRLFDAAVSGSRALLQISTWKTALAGPSSAFFPLLSPPWIFFFAELVLMYPRAYRGHQWYLNKFGDRYPKERKIVIPFCINAVIRISDVHA
ncbi:3-oxo-5-alpha-steroid 4-dehydrogenase-domain-containing protein [Mycena amicta]|nr:3-oxo-5-alpha-steroid 4-dehydrogenase-domain-containing protein [Mycena amicta]